MQNGPQYYLQTYLSMTSGNWVTKLYILGLCLYFIVALTAQRFPFQAYKPAFRPGLFAFSAFVTKHNSLARETAYLLSPKKKAFPNQTKKIFPLRGIPIGKPFLAILRVKNHLRLQQTFDHTIEQTQEGTFPFCSHLCLSSLPCGQDTQHQKTDQPIRQKSPLFIIESNQGFASVTNISAVSSETDTTVITIGHLQLFHSNEQAMAFNVICNYQPPQLATGCCRTTNNNVTIAVAKEQKRKA